MCFQECDCREKFRDKSKIQFGKNIKENCKEIALTVK